MHLKLSDTSIELLKQLPNFSAPLPYLQRLLVPSIVYSLASILPLHNIQLFFLLDLLFVSLLFFTMNSLLCEEFSITQARCLSWLFILLLPLMSVINYMFTVGGKGPYYYPYDTSSLFFLAAGYLLCLRAKWFALYALILIATFNRESSILLVLLIPALHWHHLRSVLKPLAWASLIFFCARFIIWLILHGHSGHWVELYFGGEQVTCFRGNILWLFHYHNLFLVLFCFAGLPLFWFGLYDAIPIKYRPVRYVALLYFLALLFIGHIREARILGEIVVLLYFPVCVAFNLWLTSDLPVESERKGLVYYINRYAVLAVLFLVFIFHQPLETLVLFFARHNWL